MPPTPKECLEDLKAERKGNAGASRPRTPAEGRRAEDTLAVDRRVARAGPRPGHPLRSPEPFSADECYGREQPAASATPPVRERLAGYLGIISDLGGDARNAFNHRRGSSSKTVPRGKPLLTCFDTSESMAWPPGLEWTALSS